MRKLLILFVSALLPWLSVRSQKPVYKDAGQPVETRVKDLLNRMTLHEKVLQLNQYTFGENDNPNNIGTEVKNLPAEIGSLIYLHTDPKLRNRIQRKAMEESRLGIPILFGFDVIHGLRTVYPISLAQACSFNPDLVTQACGMAAKESVLSGIDWTFSPMIDVARDPRWGRISECYGEDPYLNTVFGVASVKGYQGEKLSDPYSIAACLKHYVGYGVSEGGRDYRYTDISPQALWETYLPPYEACVKAGAATLMSSFNDISGVPATSNHYILTEILKNKWQHDGFVVSDWNAIEQLIYQGVAKDRKEAAYKAFHAGVEMDMRDNVYYEYLEQLVAEKKIEISQIDDAVARILRVKFRLGLFDEPYTKELTEQERYLQKEDIALAARLAEESMVLLKNEKNLLPLSSTVKRVALIGPMVKDRSDLLGAWAFKGQAEDVETIYEGMQKEFGDKVRLDYEHGNDESGFSAALKTAEASDVVVVCLGESKQWSGENASRSTIALPDIQEKLLLQLRRINGDSKIHGCLLFRPLPENMEEKLVSDELAMAKDIDGISTASLGAVFTDAVEGYAPCTAEACVKMLDHYNIPVEGKHVVVVGRSLVVGKPVAMLLLRRNASVTICHSRTADLAEITHTADIVICATGRARAYDARYFKPGQVVLDVGINFDKNGKICGDVDYDSVEPVVDAITPVPGGLGSVTTSVTMEHVVTAAEKTIR